MVSRKERREIEEQAEIGEDINNSSEEGLNRDLETKQYISDDPVNDLYQYKRMRLIPNSESEFAGLVDKDIVLANVKDIKPDPEYLRFIAETIVALDVFSNPKTVKVPLYNDEGKIIKYQEEEVLVRDPEFDIIRSFLRASFKSDLTLSRAMGKDREAVLDRTQNIGKEISKKNNNNKYGGG